MDSDGEDYCEYDFGDFDAEIAPEDGTIRSQDSAFDEESCYVPPVSLSLEKEILQLRLLFGSGSASLCPEKNIMKIFLETGFLGPGLALAFGLNCPEPVEICLPLDWLADRSSAPVGVPPKVEVRHSAPTFLLGWQLTQILSDFVRDEWFRRAGARESGASGASPRPVSPRRQALPPFGEDPADPEIKALRDQIGRLLAEGDRQSAAIRAIERSSGHLGDAMKLLQMAELGSFVEFDDHVFPSPETELRQNFPVRFLVYALTRLNDCCGYCIICDSKLTSPGLKPTVCNDPRCTWKYEEMGLGSKVYTAVQADPAVVDLFISLALAAGSSRRRELIFDPFPPDFLRDKKPDHVGLVSALQKLPPVASFLENSHDENSLRNYLSQFHPLGYRLVRWLLNSCRCHFVPLLPQERIEAITTPHQFLLLSTPPEKMATFLSLRDTHGSFFAFHGSSPENWHSILRVGLRNLSGTRLMTGGAAYGKGIYLSPNISVSFGYSRCGAGWGESQFGGNLVCIAICEVINHPSLRSQPNPHYVVPEEAWVITRFLFVSPSSPDGLSIGDIEPVLRKLTAPRQSRKPGQ